MLFLQNDPGFTQDQGLTLYFSYKYNPINAKNQSLACPMPRLKDLFTAIGIFLGKI